jgi:hypothetical protein
MLDEENDTIAAATEFGELLEKLIEVPRAESGTTDPLSS